MLPFCRHHCKDIGLNISNVVSSLEGRNIFLDGEAIVEVLEF